MAALKKEAKPFVEILYWFLVFYIFGFLSSFHKRHTPIPDYEQMTMGGRLAYTMGGAIFGAFFIWMLNSLRRWIFTKLFD